jgi:ATP-dependent DNA helicase RecG
MAKTWLVPKTKEEDAIIWLAKQLLKSKDKQAFIVCPFIDPSQHRALENVAAVKNSLEQLEVVLNKYYQQQHITKAKQLKTAILHSRLKKPEQQQIIDRLYNKDVQILVSTPMIEVGIDLPNADLIIIQAAERFGLASLHQLRGRVGRIGQESYCLLFTTRAIKSPNNNVLNQQQSKKRLQIFSQEKDGFKLAQLDLQQRGAGDIFGSAQSGFNKLQFTSWANLKIIQEAKKISEDRQDYQSLLTPYFEKQDFLNTINDN